MLLILTLLDGLAREPEARGLLLGVGRRTVSLPLRAVLWDVIMLRVLARIAEARDRGAWSLSAENAAGTLTIKTHLGSPQGRVQLGGQFKRVVWEHSATEPAVPLYPRSPHRAWVLLDPDGKYEFRALAEVAGMNVEVARATLKRALEG